jgi:two-component system chemotaxis sensor kinase CheA
MTSFLDGFLDDYYAECEEHLAVIRRGLLALESSVGQPRPDSQLTEELFRSFHSLKGIAGMVEHGETELLAHEMESYLRAIREGDVRLTTRGVDVLIEGARSLEHAIAARRGNEAVPDTRGILENLRALLADDASQGAPPTAATASSDAASGLPGQRWECVFTPSPALIARGVNVDVVRARLRDAGEITMAAPVVTANGVIAFKFQVAGDLDPAIIDAWKADGMQCMAAAREEPMPAATEPAEPGDVEEPRAVLLSSGHYVRVDLARLDELMRMIGDMVILRARLADTMGRIEPHVPGSEWRPVQENMTGLERQLRELREGVMRVRLVPVGEIFRRMPFVVRDLARETGRRVKVEMSGQDTEVDKFVVERMMDPVLHLVRNAVSHGIESVDERLAVGKPLEGTLSLAASAAGEIVRIEIADDGRGVDPQRVAQRARRAGIPVPPILDEVALLDLICSPGFSTREESDRVSGRGFGMAVARTTVQELGGSMRMTSEPGRGTRFAIELPLTLAITDALIARVGSQTFAVPQSSVREVIAVDTSAIRTLEGHEVIPYRGGALPVIRLASALRLPASDTARLHGFVVGTGSGAVGLLADRIIGQREIVVRSTVDPLIRVEGIAGATDLGDGRAVLILDVAAVARGARDRSGPRKPAWVRDIA